MEKRFRDHLRESADPIWRDIFAHPFIQDLGEGTLSRERFRFFVEQDYLYLNVFAKVLLLVGAKAEDIDTLAMFADHASGVARVEHTLHERYAELLGMAPDDLKRVRKARVTREYTGHLLEVARTGNLAEGVASVLPCYWIYREVGLMLGGQAGTAADPGGNFYADWVAAYASERFARSTSQQLELADRLGREASEPVRRRMRGHFVASSRYEHAFWDQAYRLAR